jgi:hypothetical protein
MATTASKGGCVMPDREKLIELVHEGEQQCSKISCRNCEHFAKLAKCKANMIAYSLISEGVTVRERGRWETTEVTEEWETVERFHHFHRECKYSYCDNGLGGHYFCPNCGADMRGEEDG